MTPTPSDAQPVAVLPNDVRQEIASALRLWVREKFGPWITWKTAWTAARVICAPAAAALDAERQKREAAERELNDILGSAIRERIEFQVRAEAAEASLAKAIQERDEARAEIYAPGEFRCPKCGFFICQFKIRASDGAVGGRDEPGEHCPNDGSPLWRVTWKQRAQAYYDRAVEEMDGRIAAEAEVSRLKAGAVTDWQLIESVPKDGRSIAVWLPATATEQPHAFAPVSICEDGTWWDDSTGDQIEPLAATYWAPIHAPSALSNQAGASK
jgi:hypothetical protein